jgi:hypothetical protein
MPTSAADIYGPWVEPDWDSGLIVRVRKWWHVPVPDLPDAALALFLRQEIAVDAFLDEASRRLNEGQSDDSELYEGELARAVQQVELLREQLRPPDSPGCNRSPLRGYEEH